ncbi:MAG: hypothetical protein ACI9X0_000243, partial [Kiritimatiellia bacterium]
HIFSDVPEALIRESLGPIFTFYRLRTDVGLVQKTLLCEDVDASVEALDAFYPPSVVMVEDLADQLARMQCRLVLCDIAPLGIRAADVAGIPSVLVENFTWDWIYDGYAEHAPGIAAHAPYLKKLFGQASLHLRTEPLCNNPGDGDAALAPISRAPRQTSEAVRASLGFAADARMILFNLGRDDAQAALDNWPEGCDDVRLVVPTPDPALGLGDRVVCVAAQGGPYHPDLVQACDGVVGKLGYSTVAEVYHAGVPMAYMTRSTFRESDVLEAFLHKHIPNVWLGVDAFAGAAWRTALPTLLGLTRVRRQTENGAFVAAELILERLRS